MKLTDLGTGGEEDTVYDGWITDVAIDGSIDNKGRRANKATTGQWNGASYIMVAVVLERLAYYGIAFNLVTYLSNDSEGSAESITNVWNWGGVACIFTLAGGFTANTYLGRYLTITYSFFIYLAASHHLLMWFVRRLVQTPQHVLMRVEGTPDQLRPVTLPKYLLAIRGTLVSRYDDIKRDIQIAGEVLHAAKELHEPVERLLQAIADKYNHQDIWVVGHSLGAQLALIATRSLAIEHNIVINPHLFNPPYLTAGVLVSKAMRGALNGLGDIGNTVFRRNIRVGTDKLANKCQNRMRRLPSKLCQITKSRYAENMEEDSQVLLRRPLCI